MTVAYQRKPVLWDIDLVVDEPHLVGIVGPNGAGKSTLIKAALGLVPLASGIVRVFGQAVTARAPVRMTLEDWNLFDSIPAWKDATLGSIEERKA